MQTEQQLPLTEKDYELLIDGLEASSKQSASGKKFIGELIGEIIGNKSHHGFDSKKMEEAFECKKNELETKEKLRLEDIKILQGN